MKLEVSSNKTEIPTVGCEVLFQELINNQVVKHCVTGQSAATTNDNEKVQDLRKRNEDLNLKCRQISVGNINFEFGSCFRKVYTISF